jgi:Tfp pilus assembly protein PilF
MQFKGRNESLDNIGRKLGAQYALEGSVRRDANKVRISAQLILIKDQTHVWSRQYDRELTDLLALQAEIAQAIGGEILVTLKDTKQLAPNPAQETSLSPTAYEAYDLYLKGRYFWNKRTPQGLERAIEYFQQAIDKDPNSARAYAGLADSYALMSGYDTSVPAGEVLPRARTAALKAVELDDRLAEAHTSLALIEQNCDWNWQAAEREYRRAIQLNPNYATAHHWYAEFLGLQGRFDESFAEMGRARQLDPLSLIMAADNGAILYFARKYDRAIEQFRTVLEMEPDFPRAHMIIYAFVEKGQFADALAELDRWQHVQAPPWSWGLRAYVYGRQGQPAKARRAMQQLEKLNQHQHINPVPILVAHIGVEKNGNGSFVWLQKAYAEHSADLTALKVDPTYDPLRSDPRFQAVLHKMGLVE